MMPENLYLVRHGRSDGNVANMFAKKGDTRIIESIEFRERHSSTWRLTERGVQEAHMSGGYLVGEINPAKTLYYTSPYTRAMETAAHMNLPDAQWRITRNLREREWGAFDRMSPLQREQMYAASMLDKKLDPFYWRPPEGESLADVCQRVDRIFDTLHRECSEKDVVIVCHGEVMWCMRYVLERMPHELFLELDRSTLEADRIHNGQIFHYTRADPSIPSGGLQSTLKWMRTVCPPIHSLASWTDWRELVFKKYSNGDLLETVHKYPSIMEQLRIEA